MNGSPIAYLTNLVCSNLVCSSIQHIELHKCNYICLVENPLVSREKLGISAVLNENKLV